MAQTITSKIARISTGMTAFVASGLLVYAIMSGNGGVGSSQENWRNANDRAVAIKPQSGYLDELIKDNVPQYIDQTITGSVQSDVDVESLDIAPSAEDGVEDLSVLALIRKNSDVKPGVSSGTARVSVVVKGGDTLFNISQRHGISVPDLASLNGLNEPYTIKIGQTLYVAR